MYLRVKFYNLYTLSFISFKWFCFPLLPFLPNCKSFMENVNFILLSAGWSCFWLWFVGIGFHFRFLIFILELLFWLPLYMDFLISKILMNLLLEVDYYDECVLLYHMPCLIIDVNLKGYLRKCKLCALCWKKLKNKLFNFFYFGYF